MSDKFNNNRGLILTILFAILLVIIYLVYVSFTFGTTSEEFSNWIMSWLGIIAILIALAVLIFLKKDAENNMYKTGNERLLAGFIDWLVIIGPYYLLPYIFFNTEIILLGLLFILCTNFLGVAYSIYMTYTYGQTVGKMVMGIRLR